ncbi:uncharacterized protein [Leptinotarsa decemlineata]|uniref:uncharacterized protein n=2 Tax=Leptinotarsa decemlineata TaxID=7539 RepID=UPI003D308B1E
MSTYCSVDGCLSTVGSPGISFFRCPKYSERCQRWKNVLGFIGNHRYANLTPEQSHNRIKICSLHFRADDIVNSRIHSYAVPSLRLPQDGSQKDDDDIAGTSKDFIYIDAQVQTDQLGSRGEISFRYIIYLPDLFLYASETKTMTRKQLLKVRTSFFSMNAAKHLLNSLRELQEKWHYEKKLYHLRKQ